MSELPGLGENLGKHSDEQLCKLVRQLTLMKALGYTVGPTEVMFPDGQRWLIMFHPEVDQWIAIKQNKETWS